MGRLPTTDKCGAARPRACRTSRLLSAPPHNELTVCWRTTGERQSFVAAGLPCLCHDLIARTFSDALEPNGL